MGLTSIFWIKVKKFLYYFSGKLVRSYQISLAAAALYYKSGHIFVKNFYFLFIFCKIFTILRRFLLLQCRFITLFRLPQRNPQL